MLTKQDVQVISGLLKSLEQRLDGVEQKIDKLEKQIKKGFKENREQHNEIIGHFDKEFHGLRNRVEKLESHTHLTS